MGRLGPWIYGIARNQLRRYYEKERVDARARRRLGLPTDSYVSAFDDAEARVDAANAGSALDTALGSLSEIDRQAVELRVVDEFSYREVGRVLGCSEVAARIRVMRVLQRLSRLLESSGSSTQLPLVSENDGPLIATGAQPKDLDVGPTNHEIGVDR